MKYKDRLRLIKRAVKIQWSLNRDLMLSKCFAGITASLGPISAVWFSAQILSKLTRHAETMVLVRWVLASILCGAAITALNRFFTHWSTHACQIAYRRTTNLYAAKFMSLDYEDVANSKTRELLLEIQRNDNYSGLGLNKLLWELNELIEGFTSICAGLGLTVSLFFAATTMPGYAWMNHPLAGMLVLLMVLGSAVLSARMAAVRVGLWLRSDIAEQIKRNNTLFRYYGVTLPQNAKHGMDIRIYGMHRIIRDASERQQDLERRFYGGVFTKSAVYSAVEVVVTALCYGVTYLFVALKALGGAFGLGHVVQYVGAISRFSDGVNKFVRSGSAILSAAEYLETTFALLNIPNRKYMGSLTVEKRTDNKYDVEFRDVSFRYPGTDTYALRHLNLKFQIGRRLAVVGMNGSGKTTLIKLLCRLYDPTDGEILLNGIDIRKYDYNEYMSLFSVVFQDFQLFSFKLGENVASAVKYDRTRAEACLQMAGFGARLAELEYGLDTYLNQDFDMEGVEMSGGEAQKIALARALYKNAPFIVLDEPTAALDPLAEYEIYTKFNDLIGDRTAIYISHRLSSCRFCDDIAVFENGQIVQFGSHDELLADERGKYHALWYAQAKYYAEKQRKKQRV